MSTCDVMLTAVFTMHGLIPSTIRAAFSRTKKYLPLFCPETGGSRYLRNIVTFALNPRRHIAVDNLDYLTTYLFMSLGYSKFQF
jgi:hypothetical protein